ncbi:MAG: putative zinc-binding protein [Myxococcales bacterium]|nr:putative zinc-binding protein [Myxococcales bacterium]MCB9644627.1 putative zinc-binding protein [Myxococcales bacterium]
MRETHDPVAEKREQRRRYAALPLVYSCSGCSSAAQLANTLAVRLDREALAEMSCIAGVGGDVKSLVKTAHSPRPLLVLDGCPLHCAKNCLLRHGLQPTQHIDLSTQGVKKVLHEDASPEEQQRVWEQTILPALSTLQATDNPSIN